MGRERRADGAWRKHCETLSPDALGRSHWKNSVEIIREQPIHERTDLYEFIAFARKGEHANKSSHRSERLVGILSGGFDELAGRVHAPPLPSLKIEREVIAGNEGSRFTAFDSVLWRRCIRSRNTT